MKHMPIKMKLELPEGDEIVIYDMTSAPGTTPKDELTRNVYRVDKSGNVVWQINPPPEHDLSPFVEVYFKAEGKLIAYNRNA